MWRNFVGFLSKSVYRPKVAVETPKKSPCVARILERSSTPQNQPNRLSVSPAPSSNFSEYSDIESTSSESEDDEEGRMKRRKLILRTLTHICDVWKFCWDLCNIWLSPVLYISYCNRQSEGNLLVQQQAFHYSCWICKFRPTFHTRCCHKIKNCFRK